MLPSPPPYSDPIPNSPFYSPLEWYIRGPYGPFIVGSGLSVSLDGYISSTGGGGGVSSVLAGVGITVSGSTGNVTVTNAGVTSLIAGSGVTLSGSTGNITISSPSGTVTTINTGTGLSGGPITTTGTISLTTTGVSPATYVNPTITIDATGRITSATSGSGIVSITGTSPIHITTGVNPVVSIDSASTTVSGAVQLSDSVTSTSSSFAATSLAVKTAFDAAAAAIPKSCLTAAGDLVTALSPSAVYTLHAGSNGQVLTACSACTGGLFWSTLPSSSGTVTSITAGTGLSGGTITTSGTIALNDTAVIPGSYTYADITVDQQGRLTAASSGIQPITCLDYSSAGAIVVGSGPGLYMTLPSGTNGQVLTVDTSTIPYVKWGTITQCQGTVTSITAGSGLTGGTITSTGTIALDTSCVISPSVLTAKGDLIAATAASTPTALPVGTNGQILVACSSCSAGMYWATTTIPPFGSPNYGSFYDTSTQTNTSPSSGIPVRLNTTDIANNFSVVSGSQITGTEIGVYNLQFSLQLSKTTANKKEAEVWLSKNGAAVPNTNTQFTVQGSGEQTFAALNYLVTVDTPGDYFELIWASDDANVVIISLPSAYGGPSIPSAIVTIVPVGA